MYYLLNFGGRIEAATDVLHFLNIRPLLFVRFADRHRNLSLWSAPFFHAGNLTFYLRKIELYRALTVCPNILTRLNFNAVIYLHLEQLF